MIRRVKAAFAETKIRGRRNYGSTGTVPAVPPLETRIRHHRNDMPWRRRAEFDEAQKTVPENPSKHSIAIVLGGTFVAAPLAGLFAFCVAVPDVAYDLFVQKPRDAVVMQMPDVVVGRDAKQEILDRAKARATLATLRLRQD